MQGCKDKLGDDFSIVVSFDSQGGSVVDSITVDALTYDQTFPEPTKEGHTFLGWYLDLDDEEFNYDFTQIKSLEVTVYAKWEKQAYTLTFNDFDGTLLFQTQVLYDNFLEDNYLESPERLGYTFNGWDMDLPNKMPKHDVVLIATYLVNRYTISFETYGGNQIASLNKDFNSTFTLNQPIKEGHSFLGWYLDEDFETPFTNFVVPANNITLHAKWEKQAYYITFDTQGGDYIDLVSVLFMDPIELPTPIKSGFIFEGWFFDIDYENEFDWVTMPAENTIVYAMWLEVEYQIVYYLLGGTNHENNPLTANGSVEIPLYDPTMTGFTFVGWYLNHHFSGDPVSSIEQGIYTDIELHAKWQLNQYHINYLMLENPLVGNFGILNPEETIVDVAHSNGMFTLLLTSQHRIFEHERHTIGSAVTTKYPVDMTSYFDLLEGEYITNIYAGDSHGAVLTSLKRLFMWGSNEYGQLALSSGFNGTQEPIDITGQFPLYPTEEIDLVALGSRHTIVTTTHGRIFTFGGNDVGQLGVERNGYFPNRVPIEITLAFNLDPVKFEHFKSVHATRKYSMVITSENRVFVFGQNAYGALGTGAEATFYEAPYEITERFNFLPNEDIKIAQIANNSGILVTSENRIFTWGYNGQGQLGLSLNYETIIPVPITEVIGAITLEEDEDIVDAATGYISMLLTSNGRLFITGSRDLLIGTDRPNNNRNTFAERTSLIDLNEDEIIAKVYNTYNIAASIITSNGNILSWGQTHRLGMGDHPKWQINLPSPIHLLKVVAIETYFYTEKIEDLEYLIEGYQFMGWFIDSILETPFDLNNMPAQDIIVYGHYIKLGT